MTTQSEIRKWLSERTSNATHMLVVCDTFDWSDFPVFVYEGSNIRDAIKANSMNMQKLWKSITFE